MKNTFALLLITLFFFSCAKDNSTLPSNDIPPVQNPVSTTKKTFIYTGIMNVDKYDSNMVALNNYNIININSQLFGTNPDYVLSIILNGSSLKGISTNEININIPSTYYFNTIVGGTGIFESGVLNGYNTRDSLYYFVLYKNISKENIYLTYTGKLTSSF